MKSLSLSFHATVVGWTVCLLSLEGHVTHAFQHRSSMIVVPPNRAARISSKPSSSKTTPHTTTTSTFLFGRRNGEQKLEVLAQKQVSDKEVEELLRSYGEKSRSYRRDSFSSADWIRYRRPDRFIDHLLTIYDSGLLRAVQLEMVVLTSLSTFIVLYNDLFVNGIQGWNGQIVYEPILHFPPLQLPLVPFTLSTVALGLLLTFRTNVSYSRWNEARTAWGAVINDSRSVVRMGCIWATSYTQIDDKSLIRLAEAVCSFSRTLMNRTLPPQEDAQRFLQYTHTMLTDQQYAATLRNAKHRPTAALAELTQILVEYQLNPIHQVEVERVITGLCNSLGACERIFTSPVPIFYTRHTARFLVVWLFALPLGMYDAFGSTWNHLGLIPACFGLGLFLLGIEELATQMEEPFSILPMEKMCEGSIRVPIMEQIERSIGSDRMMIPSGSSTTTSAMSMTIPDNQSSATAATTWNEGSSTNHAPMGEFPVEVLSQQFGIEFAVNGLPRTTPAISPTTSSTVTLPAHAETNDDLGSFFVAQPLSYNSLPSAASTDQYKPSSFMLKTYKTTTGSGMASYFDGFSSKDSTPAEKPLQQSMDESMTSSSVWNYGGMPPRANPFSKSPSSYMPTSSSKYRESSGSGMPSYCDSLNNAVNKDSYSYSVDTNINGNPFASQRSFNAAQAAEKNNVPDQADTLPSAGSLQYGGMPSANPWKSSSSSYMPNSHGYRSTSGSGMPSYSDSLSSMDNSNSGWGANINGNSISSRGGKDSARVGDGRYVSQESEAPLPDQTLQHGGMPSANPSWKNPTSSYMPNSSYKAGQASGSGMPSYFDQFNSDLRYANGELSSESTLSHEEDTRPEPSTPKTSYMPKSYRATSGSGMPSYFDNF